MSLELIAFFVGTTGDSPGRRYAEPPSLPQSGKEGFNFLPSLRLAAERVDERSKVGVSNRRSSFFISADKFLL